MTERTGASEEPSRPKAPGARVIRPLELVSHAIAARGVSRLPAITHELVGAESLWMGVTALEPGAGIGPHHSGDNETGIYLISGRIRLRWGERLESAAELDVGDIVFVPPRVPYEEINLSADEAAVWVVVRSRGEGFRPSELARRWGVAAAQDRPPGPARPRLSDDAGLL